MVEVQGKVGRRRKLEARRARRQSERGGGTGELDSILPFNIDLLPFFFDSLESSSHPIHSVAQLSFGFR